MMLILVILLIIIAISLNYFNLNALEANQIHDGYSPSSSAGRENPMFVSSNISTMWKRVVIILLICTLPLLWESKIYENIYLYNGLLLLTNKLNLVIWLLFITTIALITIANPNSNSQSNSNERLIFTLCALLGGIILIFGTDILTILLGLELQSYSVYILAASYRNYEPSEAAGLKYFLLGALSSALVFMGLAILYTYSGSTRLDTAFLIINSITFTSYLNQDQYQISYLLDNIILPYAAIILIFAGICWKIAAAPVHAWSIDVYDAVPTKTTSILSLIPKIALFSLLIRLIYMLIDNTNSTVINSNQLIYNTSIQIISLIIILSLIFGAVAGLLQSRIKRLLAYSSVLNVGFILMGTLLSTSIDIPIFYIIQYIITTTAIWLCLIHLANTFNFAEITLISQLQGTHSNLNGKITIVAICLTMLVLSTAGIPPMIGFFAKYFIILSAIQSGYISLALIAVLASIISTVYYLGILRAIWTKAPLDLSVNMLYTSKDSKAESTLLISLFTCIIVLYLLQYSVIYVLFSL